MILKSLINSLSVSVVLENTLLSKPAEILCQSEPLHIYPTSSNIHKNFSLVKIQMKWKSITVQHVCYCLYNLSKI